MQFGRSSERITRQIEQLELRLEELETGEAEDAAKAEAEADTAEPEAPIRERSKPKRKPLPDHLPRQEIVHQPADDGACTCPDCGSGHGQARRGRHRGAGLRAGPLPGDPARPAEICLQRVRCDHPGAGPGDADAARPRHPGHAGASAGVEVLRSSAALSAERDLCPRGARPRPLDPVRLGRPGGLAARSGRRRDPAACLCGREDPRRRHHGPGAGAGTRPDQDRTAVGLCARRSAVLRRRRRRRPPTSTAPIAAASTRRRTWRTSPASFRPTAMPGSRRSTIRPGPSQVRSRKLRAGRIAGGSSSTSGRPPNRRLPRRRSIGSPRSM